VDDLRPELNYFGKSQIVSPNLDKLADESITFDRAYCNIPVCGASRASIMTGLRPTRSRFWDHKTYAEKDAPETIVFPEYLKNNGYTITSNGKVFHNSSDHKEIWDNFYKPKSTTASGWRNYQLQENVDLDQSNKGFGPPFECADVQDNDYKDGALAQKIIKDLRKLKKQGKPFFLAAGFTSTHLPFNAPKKYWDLYKRENIQLPENNHAPVNVPNIAMHRFSELRGYYGIPEKGPVPDATAISMIHGYYASVSYADEQIGKVLDELKRLELEENTLVVLIGDHGWSLGDHGLWCKHSNFEVALRAPMIIRVPGNKNQGKCNALVEFVDIYPTLIELCGLELPDHLEGESMTTLLKNPDQSFKPFIISKWFHGTTIKTDDYSYTEWSKDAKTINARMLYDHKNDYNEFNNVVDRLDNKVIVDSLQNLLYKNRGDDFLKHPEKWF
jgi:arylsulfatase A-like enzyme